MAKQMIWPIKAMTWGGLVDAMEDRSLRDGIDNYVISYPRSGIKWLGNILERYREDCKVVTFPYFQLSHSIYEQPWKTLMCDHNLREIWNYQGFSKDVRGGVVYNLYKDTVGKTAENTTRKNVIITRDPRDVVVSHYYRNIVQRTKGGIDRVVYHDDFGIRSIVEFMNIWAAVSRMNKNYINITYEELWKNPEQELIRIFDHFGVHIHKDALSDAIEESSFKNMHRLELQAMEASQRIDEGIPVELNHDFKAVMIDTSLLHVRKGGVGGYNEELKPETINYINTYLEEHLDGAYGRYLQ